MRLFSDQLGFVRHLNKFIPLLILTSVLSSAPLSFAKDDLLPAVKFKTAPQTIHAQDGTQTEFWSETTILTVPEGVASDQAIVWAQKELAKRRAENPNLKYEVLMIQGSESSKSELSAGNPKAVELSESLGWTSTLDRRTHSSLEPHRQKKWNPVLEQIAEKLPADAPVFIGTTPTDKFQKSHLVISMIDFVCTFGMVYSTMVVHDHASWFQAGAVSLISALMSSALTYKLTSVSEWITGKGPHSWIYEKLGLGRKKVIQTIGQFQDSFFKDYLLAVSYYGIVEFMLGFVGMRTNLLTELFSADYMNAIKDLWTGVMWSCMKGMLSEGISLIGIARASKELKRRNPDIKREVESVSRVWLLFTSLGSAAGVFTDMFGIPISNYILLAVAGVGGAGLVATYFKGSMDVLERITEQMIKTSSEFRERALRLFKSTPGTRNSPRTSKIRDLISRKSAGATPCHAVFAY